MALQDAVIPIDFGMGLDTKTDPKRVAAGKFLTLQNSVFTNEKQTKKRNGYDVISPNIVGGGTISNPKLVKTYNDELVCGASGQLYAYSESLLGWKSKGYYSNIAVLNNSISTPSNGAYNPTLAVLGNIALYGYQNSFAVMVSVVDLTTNTKIASDTAVNNAGGSSQQRAVKLGNSVLAIIYGQSGSGHLAMQTVTASLGGGVVFGSEVVLDSSGSITNFDVVETSTGAAIALSVGTNLTVITIDAAGAITHTASVTAPGTVKPISINQGSNGNFWVYWADSATTAAQIIYYAVYTSTLGAVLTKTVVKNTLRKVGQISGAEVTATSQTAYYSTYASQVGGTALYELPTISARPVNSAGTVGTNLVLLANADIYSKVTTISGQKYMAVMYVSSSAPTGFLYNLTTGTFVGKFLYGRAEGMITTSTYTPILGSRNQSQIQLLTLTATNQYALAAAYITASTEHVSQSGNNEPGVAITAVTMGASEVLFDFDNIDANQALVAQGSLVLNGGIVSLYDGVSCAELGFNYDPSNVDINAASSGGNIGTGTFQYYATYSWIDGNGNLYESAPSIPFQVVFGSGSTNSTIVYVQNLSITAKPISSANSGIKINLYRTKANGTIPYLVSSVNNDNVSNYTAIPDTLADATLGQNATLYTQGNAILENIAPPPSLILWENNARLWAVDSENPATTIDYSKSAAAGYGINFSTGQLEVLIDSKGGAIAGASPMDEKTVILKKSGIGFFIGDGANDAGTGSSITPFQFVPSDVGCTNSKSVLLYPMGIIFRTLKGIYQVNRGLQVNYVGAQVEAYNAQDIQSAIIVANRNQIRFLTSNGSSLLFDYAFNQWSTFTNHTGYSADIWGGVYVYARADGSIYEENSSSTLDNGSAYAVGATSAWIALSSVQNFERVRWLLMLGDYTNGSSALHGLQISAAYDFSTSYRAGPIYYFGSANSSGVFQYRNFFSQQKCDAISLQITEITTGVQSESIDLTNMSFVAAMKQGSQKLGAGASVG